MRDYERLAFQHAPDATLILSERVILRASLRVEAVSPGLLLETARLAAQVDLAAHVTVAFFHLDSTILRHYSPQLIDSVCQKITFPEKN